MQRKRGIKWSRYGDGVLPCWVADMDFPLAAPVRAALEGALERGDLGYSGRIDDGRIPEVFAAWADRRFGWRVDPARVTSIVDVVQGIYLTIQAYTSPGDGVATLTPVYPPFLRAVRDLDRQLNCYTLERGSDGYEIDFDRLEKSLGTNTRLLLLCNPHNPSGRAFTRDELERIADLAMRRDLVVLADEIHADLVYASQGHTPFESLGPEVAARTLTMTSATKSFNIAGLRFAIAIFGSPGIQSTFERMPERVRGGVNAAGVYATEAAWSDCDDWLDDLVAYLRGNRDMLAEFVAERLPGVSMYTPEATFLSFLDCREVELQPNPFDFFLHQAGVGLSDGREFGDGGDGFVRLNFATSRSILREILERMEAALTQTS